VLALKLRLVPKAEQEKSVIKVAKDFATGVEGYWRGVRWLISKPAMLLLLLVPLALAILAFAGGIWLFWEMGNAWLTKLLMAWFSGWSDHWAWGLAYTIVKALMWFSILLVCLVTALGVLGIVSAPIYEVISAKIERELLGEGRHAVPLSQMPKLMMGEVMKALIITLVPIGLMLVPGVNLFAGLIAAFLLGWDFYDYPLARRGWSFKKRWRFVLSEFWTVVGFGDWLVIPVVQILFVPMAVAGGTILNIEALQRRGLVTIKTA
jgi:uncharacterized protein involved in cysteine biosynthesis